MNVHFYLNELVLSYPKFILRASGMRVFFMQDGASIHQSHSTKNWLAAKGVKLFNDGVWPAHSPDLNPIEHVWPLVTAQLSERYYNTKDDLWDALEVAFKAVDKNKILSLYGSMQRRLVAVQVARGGHTKY